MKTLYLALLIVAAGVILYLLLIKKPNQYVIGPSQSELDSFKASQAKKTDSLKTQLEALRGEKKADSLRHVQFVVNAVRKEKRLSGKVEELREQLEKEMPDSTRIEIQDSVISLQAVVIKEQRYRIELDSVHILSLEANFEQRIAVTAEEKQLLKDEIALTDERLAAKDSEIKRRKKAGWIKNAVIVGLGFLIFQTVD